MDVHLPFPDGSANVPAGWDLHVRAVLLLLGRNICARPVSSAADLRFWLLWYVYVYVFVCGMLFN